MHKISILLDARDAREQWKLLLALDDLLAEHPDMAQDYRLMNVEYERIGGALFLGPCAMPGCQCRACFQWRERKRDG